MSIVCEERELHSVSPSPLRVRKAEESRLLLIIDDEEQLNRTLTFHFEKEYQVHSATSGPQGLVEAEKLHPDCILLDLHLPGMDGLKVLEKLQRLTPVPAVVIMTAYGEILSAVQAIKRGAADYITKPFDVDKLCQSLRELLRPREQHCHFLREKGVFLLGDKRIVDGCPQMQEVWDAVEKLAPVDISVLLQGESGTGKELFARAIHGLSKRAQGPFLAVDCAAVPDSLWESEFFGYEKGAFTGANQSKPGLFMLAHGGTLFLDEVGNLPLLLQAKLLRVLQERAVRPLGARQLVRPDVRVIAASNTDLTQMVAQGSFRADLYYRLSAATIVLPPLRRREDLPLLMRHFLQLYSKEYGKQVDFDEKTTQIFRSYSWPGNCRELENVIRSAVLLAENHILPHHLPAYLNLGGEAQWSLEADEGHSESEGLHLPLAPDPPALLPKMNIQVSLQMDMENGMDLKQVGTTVARTIEGEIVKHVRSLGRSQAETATLLKIDPKTLRAKLKIGKDRDESTR